MPSNKIQLMIDIEGLGKPPDGVITAIGAVAWQGSKILDTFEIAIEPRYQEGRSVDADTVMWWMDQNRAAQRGSLYGSELLPSALMKLKRFCESYPPESVWARGLTYDLVMLRHAYQALDEETPWGFWCEKDSRSLDPIAGLLALSWSEYKRSYFEDQAVVQHNALDDALVQAMFVQKVLQKVDTVARVYYRED